MDVMISLIVNSIPECSNMPLSLPMLRSHGTDTPREVWRFGKPGEPFYESIVNHIRLRYSLLPYIYSMAARLVMGVIR